MRTLSWSEFDRIAADWHRPNLELVAGTHGPILRFTVPAAEAPAPTVVHVSLAIVLGHVFAYTAFALFVIVLCTAGVALGLPCLLLAAVRAIVRGVRWALC